MAPADVASDIEKKLSAGGLGYGDLKKSLFEQYWLYFEAARTKRAELANNMDFVEKVLRDGAERARCIASTVLERARRNCGIC